MHNHSWLRRSHICAELEFPERRNVFGFGGPMRIQSSRALPALLTHIIAHLGIISSSSLYLGRNKKCNFTNKALRLEALHQRLNWIRNGTLNWLMTRVAVSLARKQSTATSQATENMEIDWICCWWWPSKRVFLCFSMTVCFYYQAEMFFGYFARLHHKEMTFGSKISF